MPLAGVFMVFVKNKSCTMNRSSEQVWGAGLDCDGAKDGSDDGGYNL